jgi:hypothetical protein
MNKNPFEIRADILQLAKEYMDKQIEMNMTFAEKLMSQGSEQYVKAFQPYTFDDMMKVANEMYSFILTKEKKE